jgi:hypothetical protein
MMSHVSISPSRWTVWMLGALVLSIAPAELRGQDRARFKKQMTSYDKQLDQLAEKDEWGISKEVRKRARQWLDDAEVLLARGDAETANLVLQQVGDSVDLIQALITRKKLDVSAEEQEKTYYERKKETIPQIEEEIEQLRSRKQELEQKIETLQSQ